MADKIRLLPEVVANQIAAGEVVNRPSSVVKEMMENAIDAGADALTVEIQHGGMSLIRVTDNGCGIAAAEAELKQHRAARAAYDKKQARKRAILKSLREQAKQEVSE